MISPFTTHHNHNLEKIKKILIPIYICSPFYTTKKASLLLLFLLIILLTTQSLSLSDIDNNNNNYNLKTKKPFYNNLKETTMKVHPMPKKRNITVQYEINNNSVRNPQVMGSHKKLRRLPHIFSRVLELPFRSDADVVIEENPDCFRFTAETDNIGDVRAHMIEIHPGVMKIVVRPNGFLELASLDQLELDMWRFRLPETTRPELASAVFVDGELIVTVPKGEGGEEGGRGEEEEVWGDGANGGGFRGGMGNNNNNNNNNNKLVLVQ